MKVFYNIAVIIAAWSCTAFLFHWIDNDFPTNVYFGAMIGYIVGKYHDKLLKIK